MFTAWSKLGTALRTQLVVADFIKLQQVCKSQTRSILSFVD